MKRIQEWGWHLACATVLLTGPSLAMATTPLCPEPAGRVALLLIPARGPSASCDLAALERLPQKTLSTRLPASLGLSGTHRWSGVPLSHLARQLGAGPQSAIHLVALNHYAISVPMSDLQRYDPVLALRRNGERIGVREKGPLMLIYPFDAHPELETQEYLNRSIWQVNEIRIK